MLSSILQAGAQGLAAYFGAKGEKDDWAERLRMEIALERMRNKLPDWAYKALKAELSKPLVPHGTGAPRTGSFMQLSNMAKGMVKRAPTQGVDLRQALTGGLR